MNYLKQPLLHSNDHLKKKKWRLLFIGYFHVVFTSGIVLGWVPLLNILVKRHAFINLCATDEKNCDVKIESFANVFLLGIFGNYISNLFFGYILDNFGSKKCSFIACIFLLIGVLIFLLYEYIGENWLFLGYFLLGFSGPGIQIPTLKISNLFPNQKGNHRIPISCVV